MAVIGSGVAERRTEEERNREESFAETCLCRWHDLQTKGEKARSIMAVHCLTKSPISSCIQMISHPCVGISRILDPCGSIKSDISGAGFLALSPTYEYVMIYWSHVE